MNTRLNVYGLFAHNELPMLEILLRDYQNDANENLIEIARRQSKLTVIRRYSAIIIIVGDDGCYVYPRDSLR